ncbi:MAG TPA: helix-turn-helix transcriptional regulator [Pseudonocardiaceae bacterium]|nr:helix-turn-helix transcriptional regulator [Pseudonocardiaceae bacterium]
MSERAEPTVGDRIREFRRSRYTQVELAVAADVSVDVIRKLEQGRRLTASIGTLQRIARVLDVDVGELLGSSRPVPSSGPRQTSVMAIRDALTSVDDLLGELDDVDAPDLTEFDRAVRYAFGLYWAGRYGPLATMLPRLLTEAAAATHGAAPADSARAADLAAQVHRIAASALLHLGAPDLGHVAAREALRWAGRAPDPVRAAAVCCSLGHVLMRQGRFVDAERVSVATAEAIQPHGEVSMAQLSVYGGLLLRGATAAARQRRAGAAADLLAEAGSVAQRIGTDRADYDVVFGPGHHVMGAVDCFVVAEDYVAAAQVARTMPPDAALPLSTRSRHLADVAHAHLRLGHSRAAESVLLAMEQAAPEWTAHQQLPRVLVGELMMLGRPSPRLRALAERLQVQPAPRNG